MNNTKRFPRAARTLRSALFFCGAALAPAAAFADAWPSWMRLPEQASTYAPQIDDMFHLIMWITGVIFVIVEAMLLIFLWKYRHREGRVATYTHGNNRLEVIWTIIPALICVMLALLSRRMWEEIKEHMPQDAIHVQVTGEQFAWNFRYPGADGKFNTPDDLVTLNQLHFPVGKPVIVDADLQGRHPLVLPSGVPRQAGRGSGDEDAHLVRGHEGRPLGDRVRRAVRPRALPDEGLRHGGYARGLPEVDGRAGRVAGGRARSRRSRAQTSTAQPAAAPAPEKGVS